MAGDRDSSAGLAGGNSHVVKAPGEGRLARDCRGLWDLRATNSPGETRPTPGLWPRGTLSRGPAEPRPDACPADPEAVSVCCFKLLGVCSFVLQL